MNSPTGERKRDKATCSEQGKQGEPGSDAAYVDDVDDHRQAVDHA